jgi:hypothetical protein
VGAAVGEVVGSAVGAAVGDADGETVGAAVGAPVGLVVGADDGASVGTDVGAAVGGNMHTTVVVPPEHGAWGICPCGHASHGSTTMVALIEPVEPSPAVAVSVTEYSS